MCPKQAPRLHLRGTGGAAGGFGQEGWAPALRLAHSGGSVGKGGEGRSQRPIRAVLAAGRTGDGGGPEGGRDRGLGKSGGLLDGEQAGRFGDRVGGGRGSKGEGKDSWLPHLRSGTTIHSPTTEPGGEAHWTARDVSGGEQRTSQPQFWNC